MIGGADMAENLRQRGVRASRSGYNESKLARQTGYSPSTIHRVLAGERRASSRLCDALRRCGVDI